MPDTTNPIKLTEEQKGALPRYTQKWMKIGQDSSRITLDQATDVVHGIQAKILKRDLTPVLLFDNPLEAWVACNFAARPEVKINEIPGLVKKFFEGERIPIQPYSPPYLSGSFDAPIFAFYDYFRNEIGVSLGEDEEAYQAWEAEVHVGKIFPLEHVTIVSQKPTFLGLDEENRVHCDGGPAISYDGKGDLRVYQLHGVTVPQWLAETPAREISIERYREITNADQQMAFLEKVGLERMIDRGRVLDTWENYPDEPIYQRSQYRLIDMADIFPAAISYAPHLQMTNFTTGVYHLEGVSPDVKNIPDALKFRLGGEVEILQGA